MTSTLQVGGWGGTDVLVLVYLAVTGCVTLQLLLVGAGAGAGAGLAGKESPAQPLEQIEPLGN